MERERPKDLNYLFFRQQVERIRAQTAASDAARKAHEELAEAYEEQIVESTAETFTLPANNHQPDRERSHSTQPGLSTYSVIDPS